MVKEFWIGPDVHLPILYSFTNALAAISRGAVKTTPQQTPSQDQGSDVCAPREAVLRELSAKGSAMPDVRISQFHG